MNKNMTVNQSGLHLPVSRAFINIIAEYLPPPPLIPPAVTLNFRDPKYSAESGGSTRLKYASHIMLMAGTSTT